MHVLKGKTDQNRKKTFVIDHPLDSQRFLVHGCLEGPEAGVYYRGKYFLSKGEYKTTIKLPSYTSVFKDFTVHVNSIGFPLLLGVSEVENGYFRVYSSVSLYSDTRFNWVVYGTRQSIDVEPLKMETEIEGSGPYLWVKN